VGGEIAVDPEGFERRLSQYQEWLKVNHFSEQTALSRGKYLRHLVAWSVDRGLTRPAEVTKPILERYQATLYHYRKKNGEPLSLTSQRNYLTSLKGFFKWLARQNHILYNPASEILLPRLSKRLPKHVLTVEEAERVLALADTKTPLGVRDRAILETLYSTGLRRMEAVALKLYDLDRDRGTLMVREGKGRSQRVIPIGDRALKWVEKYLQEVRPELVVPPDEGYIFLTHHGKPFEIGSLTEFVRVFVERAGIGKKGSVHLFRHTMATLLLEGGADVRYVQAMLGHAKLETTQIYTQVSIRKLKEVHTMAHPAKLKKPKPGGRPEEAGPSKS
jgi:integrase/recombinase XerD